MICTVGGEEVVSPAGKLRVLSVLGCADAAQEDGHLHTFTTYLPKSLFTFERTSIVLHVGDVTVACGKRNPPRTQKDLQKETRLIASAGSRTRTNCLEGNYPTVGPLMHCCINASMKIFKFEIIYSRYKKPESPPSFNRSPKA